MIMTLYSYQFRRIRVAFEFDCSALILFKSSTLAFQRSNVNLKITNFTNFPWNAWRLWNFWYLTLNVEQIKGQKKALLCLVTKNYSLIVWSERVTELKVMKGTFQTEIAFSCVSKMKVVVYLSLLCSSDSIKYMLCTFSWKRNIKNLPWQTMTREVQTQDWEIFRNQHPNEEKRRN